MRKIKFRAWDTKKNGWVVFKGALPFLPNEPFNIMDLTPLDAGIIIEQYTGLRDAKGKEIYEGDTRKHRYINKYCIMKWIDQHARFMWAMKVKDEVEFVYTPDEDDEVIGNIHESPELLDVK